MAQKQKSATEKQTTNKDKSKTVKQTGVDLNSGTVLIEKDLNSSTILAEKEKDLNELNGDSQTTINNEVIEKEEQDEALQNTLKKIKTVLDNKGFDFDNQNIDDWEVKIAELFGIEKELSEIKESLVQEKEETHCDKKKSSDTEKKFPIVNSWNGTSFI